MIGVFSSEATFIGGGNEHPHVCWDIGDPLTGAIYSIAGTAAGARPGWSPAIGSAARATCEPGNGRWLWIFVWEKRQDLGIIHFNRYLECIICVCRISYLGVYILIIGTCTCI